MRVGRTCIGVFLLAPWASLAPAYAGFLCQSEQPYEHVSVVSQGGKSRLLFSLPRASRVIELRRPAAPGKAPGLATHAGPIALRVLAGNQAHVELYRGGVRVALLEEMMDGGDAVPAALLVVGGEVTPAWITFGD